MPGLDDLVRLVITKLTTTPSRIGFGTPAILAYHTVFPELAVPFKSGAGMLDAGFLATDPAYLAAQKMFSQNPRPAQVIIGRRSNPFTKIVRIYPKNIAEGEAYTFDVIDPAGIVTAIEYVIPNGATVASVATALAALIDPVTDVAATATATYVSLAAPVGKLFDLRGLPSRKFLEIKDVTVDPGVADDIAAFYAADPTTWYALTLDSQSPAEISAAAEWIEPMRKIGLFNTSESDVLKANVDTDVASLLSAAEYARTALLYSGNRLQSYSAHAWTGLQLPKAPGSSTWMFKTLKTILPDLLTDAEQASLETKHANWYATIGRVPITAHGYTAAGESDFLDIVHGIDWLYARIQEAVFGALANAEKIAFTDDGIAIIVSQIDGVLRRAVTATLLASDPAPNVTAPKAAAVELADKILRNLPGVEFTGRLAGAIHSVDISGVLSV